MSKELIVFDSLKADIAQFVAPVLNMRVVDFKTSADAIEAGKHIKSYMKQVESARTSLVHPLNDQVKSINSYARGVNEPLEAVEAHIKGELTRFAVEQERIKQEEFRKAEAIRLESERKARIEAERLAAEQQAARQAEIKRIQEEAQEAEDIFGTKVDSTAQIQEAELAAERERLETQARFEREKSERETAANAARFDASQHQIKNVRKNWKVKIIDISLVPKEFLIIELNEKMALASARGGNTSIAGLEFYQDTSISLGQNTYVPKAALQNKN